MALKDEAGGGGSGAENRVLFFELVAGTKLLLKGKDAAITIFKSMGDSWSEMMTGMDTETQAKLAAIDQKFQDVAAKQKAAMDDLVASTTASYDAETAAAEAAYEKQQAALAEMVAKQQATYEESLNAVVAAQTAAVDKAIEQATKQADAQIEQSARARDAQIADIAKIREGVATSGDINRSVSNAGVANIGQAVAGAATQQQYQQALELAKQNSANMIAVATEQAAGIAQEAQQSASEQLTTARTTASSLLAQATAQKEALITEAKETAAGIITAQESENTQVISGLTQEKTQLADSASAWTSFTSAIKTAAQGLAVFTLGITMLGGVMAALFEGLKSLTDAVSSWATEIAQAGEATGLTYKNVQVYLAIVEQFGVSHAIAETILTRFNKRLQENAGLFQTLGITAKDPNEALVQFMNNLDKSADKLQYFNTIIGGTVKSGSVPSLIDAFDKLASEGSYVVSAQDAMNDSTLKQGEILTGAAAGIQRYAVLMEQTGMMLDNSTVAAGALNNAIETQLGDAFEGLKMRLGQAILPDFQALELVIIQLISGTKASGQAFTGLTNVFSDLAKWIADAMGWLIGFIAGLTGMTKSDLAAWLKNIGEGASALANGTTTAATSVANLQANITALQQQEKNLQNSTQAQTEALDAQTTALQRNQTLFDQAHDDKLKALQDEKQNYDDQLKLQDDLHQSYLVQLQDELSALQDSQSNQRQSSEDLASYETRLAEQSLQTSIQNEQNRRQTVDDTYQQQIDQLSQLTDAQKEAYDDNTTNLVNSLDDQKTALQDNLTKQEGLIEGQIQTDQNLLSSSASSTAGTVANQVLNLTNLIQTAITAMDNTATAGGITFGQNFVKTLKQFLADPGGALASAAKKVGTVMGKAILTGMWEGIEDAAGAASKSPTLMSLPVIGSIVNALMLGKNVVNGVSGVLGNATNGLIGQAPAPVGNAKNAGPALNNPVGAVFHADGGVFDTPHMAWISEGYKPEAVVPLTNPGRAAQVMQQAGLGGNTFVTHFNGPVATGAVASTVMTRLAAEAKRQGLVFAGGTAL